MRKVCIIGGGIVGSVAAYYLSRENIQVNLYDESKGQATKAAVGIICPWISQRRNKEWYQLVQSGAVFYHQLIKDLGQSDFYLKSGSLHTHKNIQKLYELAQNRKEDAMIMGNIEILSGEKLKDYCLPEVKLQEALYIEGSACVDGKQLVETLLGESLALGARVFNEKVYLDAANPKVVKGIEYDAVFVCAGAWINDVFKHLDYDIDVFGQKGQLIEYENFFNIKENHYPFIVPQGQIDLMFDLKGSLIIGASHENEMGFDLVADSKILQGLKEQALDYIPSLKDRDDYSYRVGTRAHSSDFNPFYGLLEDQKGIYVASALGSSGLTSGPIIGYRLAQSFIHNNEVVNQSDVSKYIKRKA